MKTYEILAKAKPFKGQSFQGYKAYVKRQIINFYQEPIKAKYDKGMNCLSCGESGRCPGYHTQDDLI